MFHIENTHQLLYFLGSFGFGVAAMVGGGFVFLVREGRDYSRSFAAFLGFSGMYAVILALELLSISTNLLTGLVALNWVAGSAIVFFYFRTLRLSLQLESRVLRFAESAAMAITVLVISFPVAYAFGVNLVFDPAGQMDHNGNPFIPTRFSQVGIPTPMVGAFALASMLTYLVGIFATFSEVLRRGKDPWILGGLALTALFLVNEVGMAAGVITATLPLLFMANLIEMVRIGRLLTLERQARELRTMSLARLAELGINSGEVAHDIRNPLAVIKGSVSRAGKILRKDPNNLSRVLELLERAETGVAKTSGMLESVRKQSRAEDHEHCEMNLGQIVHEVELTVEQKLTRAGVQFQNAVAHSGTSLWCQPFAVERILINLVVNAVDAIEEHSPAQRWVRLESHVTQGQLEIRVVDSGPGVPRELRDKIFDQFFTTKDAERGTGLGLAMAKDSAQYHGGDLTYSNEELSTFSLILPLEQSKEDSLAA